MKIGILRNIIYEAYAEVLAEDWQLKTSKDTLLGRFPTLKKTIENLFTAQYDDFVEAIDWVAPKPSTFKVVLKNDQTFYLKWLGTQFQAQIQGKRYVLGRVDEFQQALDRISELLKQSQAVEKEIPEDTFEEPEAAGADFGSTGGAADFGSGDDFATEEPETPDEEEFEFEEPGEEPEV
jgi:hypothetical protein